MSDGERKNPGAVRKGLNLSELMKNGNFVLLLLIILVVIILGFTVPSFATANNIFNLLVQASNIGLPAIGLTFILITAGNDLSLPTNMACSAILGCGVMQKTQSVFLGVLTILVVALLFGVINGFSVAKLKMVPMIVTLAVQTLNVGISEFYTQGTSVGGLPESFSKIFAGTIGGIVPLSVIIFLLVAVVMHQMLTKTVFGRQLFQTGINEKAAKVNGVNTTRILFIIYVIGGLMAGVNGVLTAARLNSAGPTIGPASAFNNIICACVLGGASVWGGKGSVMGAVLGSIIMALITNAMNLLNINFFVTYVIKGAIIVAVCYLDVIRNGRKGAVR